MNQNSLRLSSASISSSLSGQENNELLLKQRIQWLKSEGSSKQRVPMKATRFKRELVDVNNVNNDVDVELAVLENIEEQQNVKKSCGCFSFFL